MRRISPGDGATLVSPHLARPDPVASLRGALEEGPMKRSLPADRSEWTPEETKHFLEFYAGVLERESHARTLRQPDFSADQLGRASCRARACQYVYITVVAISFKINTVTATRDLSRSKLLNKETNVNR